MRIELAVAKLLASSVAGPETIARDFGRSIVGPESQEVKMLSMVDSLNDSTVIGRVLRLSFTGLSFLCCAEQF